MRITNTAPSIAAPAPSSPPWYRHRWPWFLMLGPGIVLAAGVYTTWLAISSQDGLVADDYYKRGLAINRTLERSRLAATLHLGAIVDVTADGAARVRLLSPTRDLATAPPALQLKIRHPTHARLDLDSLLVRGPEGDYTGRVKPVAAGRWRVSVETDAWRLPAVDVAGVIRDVRLGTAK